MNEKPLQPAEVTDEPVYQICRADSVSISTAWVNVQKQQYEDAALYTEYVRRVLYTHPAPGVPKGYVLVPISDLEDAEESIDDYRKGLEFGLSDTSILDRLGALITAAQAQKGD